MHKNVRLSLRFLCTIRGLLVMSATQVAAHFSSAAPNWRDGRSGLNQARREYLEDSDRRQAGSEPPSALQPKS
jgi:hypothetical protein